MRTMERLANTFFARANEQSRPIDNKQSFVTPTITPKLGKLYQRELNFDKIVAVGSLFQSNDEHKKAQKTKFSGHFRSGDEGGRTPNPRVANAVLSQLSYVPKIFGVNRPNQPKNLLLLPQKQDGIF